MIFSRLLRRLFLLLSIALVSVSPNIANAQCPGGKPPNRDGSCGKPQEKSQPNNGADTAKSPRSNDANTCSINVRVVKQGGEPVAAVNLALDDSNQSAGFTDASGSYKFIKLPCKRKYKVTPAHPRFTFNLAYISIANLRKNDSAVFMAAARGTTTPNKVSRKEPRPCNPPPKTLPRVTFEEPVPGKLSPQTSGCDDRTKRYFQAYQLEGAFGGDIVQFDLQSAGADGAIGADGQSSDLFVQVIDPTGNEIAPDGESDGPSSRQVVLPTPGAYTLRVISKSDKSSDYRLSVTRKGLTDEGYRGQLERAYAAIAEPDRPTFYSSLNFHLERLKSFAFNDGK